MHHNIKDLIHLFGGNEPSFHIPYPYNFAGELWRAQKRIHMIMESQFRNDLMDIPGDEDGDGMSAYCMFSAMGFYPVSAGKPVSASAVSCIPKQSIHLNNGNVYHQSQQCLMEQQIHPIGKVERTGVEQTVVHP